MDYLYLRSMISHGFPFYHSDDGPSGFFDSDGWLGAKVKFEFQSTLLVPDLGSFEHVVTPPNYWIPTKAHGFKKVVRFLCPHSC